MRDELLELTRALRSHVNEQWEALPRVQRVVSDKPRPVEPVRPKAVVQEAELLLGAVKSAVAKVAPQMGHVEKIPTEARPRCLLVDCGRGAEERAFLERLAQALTNKVAPTWVVPAAKLAQMARPPVKLLVAFKGVVQGAVLPLVELEAVQVYQDKATKLALWNQLCQKL